MRRLKKYSLNVLVLLAVIIAFLGLPEEVAAQCQACKSTVETNLASGGTAGLGLNKGILYLLSMPYIMALTIGGVWYFKFRNKNHVSHGQAA